MDMPRGWRRRRGRRGRLPKPVRLESYPTFKEFTPQPQGSSEPVKLNPAELEAIRLVDLKGLTQEEAGSRMRISRGTVWRLLKSGRRKLAKALVESRPLTLIGEVG